VIMKTTDAKAGSRLRLPLGIVSLAVLTSVGCQLTLGHDTAKAPDSVAAPAPAPESVSAAEKSSMCVVDGVASSPGTRRCFYGDLMVCEASGSWRTAEGGDHSRLVFGDVCNVPRDSGTEPTPSAAGRSKR
jgi:hypothetical protein